MTKMRAKPPRVARRETSGGFCSCASGRRSLAGAKIEKTASEEGQQVNQEPLGRGNQQSAGRTYDRRDGVDQQHPEGPPERIAGAEHDRHGVNAVGKVVRYDGRRDEQPGLLVRLKAQPDGEAVHEAVDGKLGCAVQARVRMPGVMALTAFADPVHGDIPIQGEQEQESCRDDVQDVLEQYLGCRGECQRLGQQIEQGHGDQNARGERCQDAEPAPESCGGQAARECGEEGHAAKNDRIHNVIPSIEQLPADSG